MVILNQTVLSILEPIRNNSNDIMPGWVLYSVQMYSSIVAGNLITREPQQCDSYGCSVGKLLFVVNGYVSTWFLYKSLAECTNVHIWVLFTTDTQQWRIQDFPGGAPTPHGGCQHTILPKFPENCMKSKEFGCPGGHVPPTPPLNPPLHRLHSLLCHQA